MPTSEMVDWIMLIVLIIHIKWYRLACCIYMPYWQRRVYCRLYIVQQTTTPGSHIPTTNLPTLWPWPPLHVHTTDYKQGHRENFAYQGNHGQAKPTDGSPHCKRRHICSIVKEGTGTNGCFKLGGRGDGIVTCGSCAHCPPPIPLAHWRVPGDVWS